MCIELHVVMRLSVLLTGIQYGMSFRTLHTCVSCILVVQIMSEICHVVLVHSFASVSWVPAWILIFYSKVMPYLPHVEWLQGSRNLYAVHWCRPFVVLHVAPFLGQNCISAGIIDSVNQRCVPSKHSFCIDVQCLFSHDIRLATYAYLLGTRVGEASHPGPDLQTVKLAVTDQSSCALWKNKGSRGNPG